MSVCAGTVLKTSKSRSRLENECCEVMALPLVVLAPLGTFGTRKVYCRPRPLMEEASVPVQNPCEALGTASQKSFCWRVYVVGATCNPL